MMMVAAGSFNSLGRPMPAAVMTFVKFFIVYLPLAYLLSTVIGITGIFWANAISHVLFGAVAIVWTKRVLYDLHSESRSARVRVDLAGP
jgi:Na+-driven multidrug efflux pump